MVSEKILSLSLDDLNLSSRSSTCLKKAHIYTVKDFLRKIKTPEDLLAVQNLGEAYAKEVYNKLEAAGVSLFLPHSISEEDFSHKISLPITALDFPETAVAKLLAADVLTVSDLMYNLVTYADVYLFDFSETEVISISNIIRSMGLRLGIFNEPISNLGNWDGLCDTLEMYYKTIQDILKAGLDGLIDTCSTYTAGITARQLRKAGYLLPGYNGLDDPKTREKLYGYLFRQPIYLFSLPDPLKNRLLLAYGETSRFDRIIRQTVKNWFSILQNFDDCILLSEQVKKIFCPVRGADDLTLGEDGFLQKNTILYTPLEDIDISNKLHSMLVDNGISSVKQLVSFSATELREQKIVGDAALSTLRNVLFEGNLLLKDDYLIKCPNCKTQFISDTPEITDCPNCIAKQKRISKITKLDITLSGPDYGSYTDLSSGFTLYANMKNTSSDLLKVRLIDFYVVEDDKQISPKWFLTGYTFNEEMIMPATVKSAGKIWSTERFKYSSFLSSINTYAVLVIRVASEKYKRMYKFAYDNDTWILEDYFTVY